MYIQTLQFDACVTTTSAGLLMFTRGIPGNGKRDVVG